MIQVVWLLLHFDSASLFRFPDSTRNYFHCFVSWIYSIFLKKKSQFSLVSFSTVCCLWLKVPSVIYNFSKMMNFHYLHWIMHFQIFEFATISWKRIIQWAMLSDLHTLTSSPPFSRSCLYHLYWFIRYDDNWTCVYNIQIAQLRSECEN